MKVQEILTLDTLIKTSLSFHILKIQDTAFSMVEVPIHGAVDHLIITSPGLETPCETCCSDRNKASLPVHSRN